MHIRVGFGVARFDYLSNARASMRGTSDNVPTLFFAWLRVIARRNDEAIQLEVVLVRNLNI
jgi:hypothetical protein